MKALLLLVLLSSLALAQDFALKNLRVVDDRGARDHLTVVVKDGKIAAVGPKVAIPKGIKPQDCTGFTLLPGFIDCHVHLPLHPAERVARGGVTTVRDLGWRPADIFKRARELRARGPWVVAAGGMICAPKGYPGSASWAPKGTALEVASVAQAEARVDEMANAGAGVIKVALEPSAGPTLSADLLKAVVRRARARGLKVTAHVSTLAELDKAIAAGVDELAHFTFDATRVPDDRLKRMLARKIAVCPTLHVAPDQVRVDNVQRYHALGGTILYGTDMGNAGIPAGIDVEELEWMRTARMSRQEIIAAATWRAAQWLGLKDRGRIQVGLRADLILVEGDPLRDFRTLKQPKKVWYGGRAL